jgi:hypothetical protein
MAKANLGTLQITHNCHDLIFCLGNLAQGVDNFPMGIMVTMGEVNAGNSHASV